MPLEYVGFSADTSRAAEVEFSENGIVSAARIGKQYTKSQLDYLEKAQARNHPKLRKERHELQNKTPIEDNGFAASHLSDSAIAKETAEKLLHDTYSQACAQEYGNDNNQVGCTAASAVLTTEGVSFRAAGDGVVLVIGHNGNAITLNQLHNDELGRITNSLMEGKVNREKDSVGFHEWDDLKVRLKANNVRIVTMSDGCFGIDDPTSIASLTSHVIRAENLDVNDPNFSKNFIDALEKVEEKSFPNPDPKNPQPFRPYLKEDDKIVVSAQMPKNPNEQSVLHAFDGIGSGGRESGIFAANTVKVAQEQTENFFPKAKTKTLEIKGGALPKGMQIDNEVVDPTAAQPEPAKTEEEQPAAKPAPTAEKKETTKQEASGEKPNQGKTSKKNTTPNNEKNSSNTPSEETEAQKGFSWAKTGVMLGALGTAAFVGNNKKPEKPEAEQEQTQKKQNWFQRNFKMFAKALLVLVAVDMGQSMVRGTKSYTEQGIGKFTNMINAERQNGTNTNRGLNS